MRVRQRGFTLIELVAVVFITALLASMAIPRFANSIARRRLELAAIRLSADIGYVRQRAYATSQAQSIAFDLAAQSYRLAGVVDSDTLGRAYSVDLAGDPYYAQLVDADFGGARVLGFDGYGAPVAGGEVRLRVADAEAIVAVDAASGEVTRK